MLRVQLESQAQLVLLVLEGGVEVMDSMDSQE